MNSSISNSERGWRRLLRYYLATTLVLVALVGAFILLLDPYDTGRFAAFGDHGVPQTGQRLAVASLGRNKEFNSAIIGNSTIQLVDPGNLNDPEHKVVSLTIPGTGPREQIAVAEWFLEHHIKARTLIIGLDDRWCAANAPLEFTHPFPFWLYSNNAYEYALNMMQYQSIESAFRKIKLLRGKSRSLVEDGYNNYDTGHWDKAGFEQRLNAPNDEAPFVPVPPPYDFPAQKLLTEFIMHLPPETSLILVMPPQYQTGYTETVAQRDACKKVFSKLTRPQVRLVDFVSAKALTSKEEDYWDRLHYRARVARIMEKEIRSLMKAM